jgi:hypothetical protein
MNVETITIPANQAREQLRAYRRSLHRRADQEYEVVAKGLEQLERGRPLLILSAALAEAPRDEKGRPRLAIARSDRREVYYYRYGGNTEEVFDSGFYSRGRAPLNGVIRVQPTPATPRASSYASGYSIVPLVPPQVRETRDLSKFFTLWEVEAWADRPSTTVDRDPFLLERVTDDVFAIVAEWDLSPLEQAIAASFRRSR